MNHEQFLLAGLICCINFKAESGSAANSALELAPETEQAPSICSADVEYPAPYITEFEDAQPLVSRLDRLRCEHCHQSISLVLVLGTRR